MLPDQVSNSGPLTYESGALPIALRGPAHTDREREREREFLTVKLSLSDSLDCFGVIVDTLLYSSDLNLFSS